MTDIQKLIDSRNAVIEKCEELLSLKEEIFPKDSLELSDIYQLIGEAYKWFPRSYNDCLSGALYLEKTVEIWRKYKDNQNVQIQLARLLIDLGGIYGMQKDYKTELSYRLEALKIVKNMKNIDLKTLAEIEVSLKGTYESMAQSRTVDYNTFLENNGLSTVIESVQIQPLGNGWGNIKVKILGAEEEYNWKMTLGSQC